MTSPSLQRASGNGKKNSPRSGGLRLLRSDDNDNGTFSFVWRALQHCTRRNLCLAATVIFVILFCNHRFATHQMNHQTWVKAPINDLERTCPAPAYPVQAAEYAHCKICITTLTDAAKGNAWQTWPNKEHYAQKHGYYLFDETTQSLDPTRPPSWSKIRAAQRLMKEEDCDWVFWMDTDTVIMNSEKRIQDFLPIDGRDVIITKHKDDGSYHAGAWLVRNTPWAYDFLETWWNMDSYVHSKGMSTSGDSAALQAYLLSMDPDYLDKHVAVPAPCNFHSATVFLTPDHAKMMTDAKMKEMFWYHSLEYYHKGDFVAHVAGVDNKITATEMLLKDAV